MKIAIIGAGGWGTTLSNLIAENNPSAEVFLWAREEEICNSISQKHENELFLKGKILEKSIIPTNDIGQAIKNADFIVTAVPSQYLRQKCKEMHPLMNNTPTIINVSKGFEFESFKRMSQVICEELPQVRSFTVLSGPNHAEEVSRKIPTATVIATESSDTKQIKKIFQTDYFRVYPHTDVIGVEIAGAVKNITALATGTVHALGLGDNALGSIITLGLREMVTLGRFLGAKQGTFYGLAGVGDLVATCTSKYSRNRKAGALIAKGLDSESIKNEMQGQVAEGIYSVKSIYEFSQKNNLKMPLTKQVYEVIYEKKAVDTAIQDLKQLI